MPLPPKGRKPGSSIVAGVFGVLLLGLAGWLAFTAPIKVADHANEIDGVALGLFGVVLLWWAISYRKAWGIGLETVTMVIGVVTAAIAVLALTSGK